MGWSVMGGLSSSYYGNNNHQILNTYSVRNSTHIISLNTYNKPQHQWYQRNCQNEHLSEFQGHRARKWLSWVQPKSI